MSTELLHELSVALGLGRHDLLRIIDTAPKRYKVFQIPKRSGGMRTIAQPSRELKELQRFVIGSLLVRFPVHRSASAYVTGSNIFDNAKVHSGNKAILKMDFEDFFPSIKVRDWERYVKSSNVEFEAGELNMYSRILFWGKGSYSPTCLSIGAPTSPILSNILLFDLDSNLSRTAKTFNVVYTRYADDITVSGASIEAVEKFERVARSFVRKMKTPRLTFNEKKRGLYTMGQRRMVTGLILTPDGNVSVGRERKRLVSAMLHRLSIDECDAVSKGKLKGLLGFCIANEPSFVSRMREKYGDRIVDRALTYVVPPKVPGTIR